MSDTTATGLPIMTSGDAPDIPADVGIKLGGALDKVTVPLFASTSARDTAYASKPFGLCFVGASVAAGTLYRRNGTSWDTILTGDTGWTNCTTNSGFTEGAQKPQARKLNGTVYLRGGWTNAGLTASSVNSIASLPASITGPPDTLTAFVGSDGTSMACIVISPSGAISLRVGASVPLYSKMTGISYPAS